MWKWQFGFPNHIKNVNFTWNIPMIYTIWIQSCLLFLRSRSSHQLVIAHLVLNFTESPVVLTKKNFEISANQKTFLAMAAMLINACQVWFQWAMWFRRIRFKCEKFKDDKDRWRGMYSDENSSYDPFSQVS